MKFQHLMVCLFAALWGSQSSQAQTLFKTSVYFNSGQSNLHFNSEASIDSLIARLEGMSDYELRLWSYCDDMGDTLYNQALAEQRSHSVYKYLINREFQPVKQGIQSVGELQITAGLPVSEQRKRNRRVDIEVVASSAAAWRAFFGLCKNEQQVVAFASNEDNFVVGNKGLKLHIPSRSFYYAEDPTRRAPDSLVLTLQEAYTAQDLITMNVPTMSNGQFLETGGSFYIGVTDKEGNALSLRPNKELLASIPSENANTEGMRIFTAERSVNQPEMPIEWASTPQMIQTAAINPALQTANSLLETIAVLEDKSPKEALVFPSNTPIIAVFPGEEPREPQRPQMKHYPYTTDAYTNYLNRTFRAMQRADMPESRAWYRHYKENYPAILAKYHTDLANFQGAAPSIQHYMDSLALVRQQFSGNLKEVAAAWAKVFDLWSELSLWQESEAEYAEFTKAIEAQKNVNLGMEWKKMMQKNEQFRQDLAQIFSGFSASPYRIARQNNAIMRSLVQLEGADMQKWTAAQWQDFKAMHEIATEISNSDLNRESRLLLDLCKEHQAFISKLLAHKAQTTQLLNQLKAGQRGFKTNEQALEQYKNVVGISKLGWTNVDKFSAPAQNPCTIEVLTDMNKDVKFYLVVDGGKSVLEMAKGAKGVSLAGLDKNYEVEIVGMRATLGIMEVFKVKGKAGALGKVVPKFELKKPEEVRNWLAAS